ncbi:hypothetical protein LAC81_05825 [Ensifer adhaerens]|uniref:hypothetical protein n=1 Tax=Ensifer adhaerens TaxID=106592 RepID=UPI001CBED4E7|nr:hypothetical protein [Ensifer adhaerens]MBZ7921304.1 hypothetical protein [Ensifer adhaerens]UAX93736.1 hypothetical protein LAC78_05820 [Ensifer adhaerens]UAY01372.1 hypothetical protein LAC80_05825 [Ensifer adhaerens]UAY08754.1 hypothetical protein LAC81_05825 [Ensifer adhaerens]
MSSSSNDIREPELRPLLSPGFVYRVTAIVVVLAALTAAISFAGRWFGENLALAGHTASNELFDIFIGQDHLRLPANMIRFEAQRATSIVERVDLYLTWPKLEGYSDQDRALFNNVDAPESLIFLQISQSTMSRDMSGRLEPIYSQVFDGTPTAGPASLSEHAVKATSSYAGEVFYTADTTTKSPYVVRCLKSDPQAISTSADCQRDIHAGKDLVVLYRFSNKLLPKWREIDQAIATFVKNRLVP